MPRDLPPTLTLEQQAIMDLLGRVEALEMVVKRVVQDQPATPQFVHGGIAAHGGFAAHSVLAAVSAVVSAVPVRPRLFVVKPGTIGKSTALFGARPVFRSIRSGA